MHHATEVTADPTPRISLGGDHDPLPGQYLTDAAEALERVMLAAYEGMRPAEVAVLHSTVCLLRAAAADMEIRTHHPQ